MCSKRPSHGVTVGLNIIVFATSVTALGLYLLFGVNVALTRSLRSTNDILNANGIQTTIYADVIDLLWVPSPLLLLLAAFLVLLLVATPLATAGAYYRNSSMIWAAAVIILLLFLLHLGIAAAFIQRMADEKTKAWMSDSIKNHYVASDDNGTYSVAWNVLHQRLGCCGVKDYTDFEGASHWKTIRFVYVGNYYLPVKLSTPFSCCRPNPANSNCATNPTDENSFYKTGCYEKARMWLIGNAIAVLLLLVIISCIYWTMRRTDFDTSVFWHNATLQPSEKEKTTTTTTKTNIQPNSTQGLTLTVPIMTIVRLAQEDI